MYKECNTNGGFGGETLGKATTWSPQAQMEDNIKMYVQGVGWAMNWIDLVKVRDRWWAIVNAVMNLQFP